MRVKPWLTLWVLGVFVVGVLMLSGCSGGSPSAADLESPTTDTTVAVDDGTPVVEDQETTSEQTNETPVDEHEPEQVVDTEPVEDTSQATSENAPPEEPTEEPLLTWGRTVGGLSHCDRMSIFPDGSTEAVVCRAGRSEPTVFATLSDEQLSQVTDWVAEYSSFTRREQEPSGAVRTTTLNGTGTTAPELAIKKEIAAFAAELYFELTGTE